MKKLLAYFAVTSLLLAGCAGQPVESDSGPVVGSTVSTSMVTTKAAVLMPEAVDRKYADVMDELHMLGVSSETRGSDGVEILTEIPDSTPVLASNIEPGAVLDDDATVVLTVGAKQSDLTAAAAVASASAVAAAEAATLAVRYDYLCWTSGASFMGEPSKFKSFEEVWQAKEFADLDTCNVDIDGKDPISSAKSIDLLARERSVVDKIRADGGDTSIESYAFASVLSACALPPKNGWGRPENGGYNWQKATAISAAAMCPGAPFIDVLGRIASGALPTDMGDGHYSVGQGIEPGTYQLQTGGGGTSDCYWERTSPQGDTIDNSYINYAPQAPVVTVFDGEGFVSERCGQWNKIG